MKARSWASYERNYSTKDARAFGRMLQWRREESSTYPGKHPNGTPGKQKAKKWVHPRDPVRIENTRSTLVQRKRHNLRRERIRKRG